MQLQLAQNSYTMLPIKTHLLPTELALQANSLILIILVALKFEIRKDAVLILMIQPFVKALEISVTKMVL
jgi:hypothetical protein